MGRPKALVEVDGRTLLERTAAVAASVSDRVVLLGQPPFEVPVAMSNLMVLPDARPGLGPIAGLHSMFQAFPTRPALLLACDLPRLEARLLERLMEELSCEIDAAAFATSAPPLGWEPCCAIYMPSSAPSVSGRIERGEYSLQGLLESVRTKTVPLTGAEAELLANMNRPEDIAGLGG